MSVKSVSLVRVNDRLNRLIRPVVEPEGYDLWQTPSESLLWLTGDCEDFAIVKLFSLLHFGYESSKLSIQTVRLRAQFHGGAKGQLINHAYLVYDGWVLDNLFKEIVRIGDRSDVAETYGIIQVETPNRYRAWNEMLARRLPELESQLIDNVFSV